LLFIFIFFADLPTHFLLEGARETKHQIGMA